MALLVQLLQGLLLLLLLQSILTTEDEPNSASLPVCYVPKDEAETVSSPSGQIINGDVVEKGTAPWMVSIALMNRLMHKCGGVLLNYEWVLTVAHCVDGSRPDTLSVIGGEYNFAEIEGTEQIRYVSRIVIHPRYDWYTKQNDIALINTKRRFYPSKGGPRPIPFYGYPPSYIGENCQIYGWGSLNEGGDIDARLRKSNQTILNEQSCKLILPGFIYDDMFCGSNDGGSGPCMGDWGGPLVCRDGELAGIASWSVGCASTNFPTVYENASYFYPWIQNVMRKFSVNLRIEKPNNSDDDLENSLNPENNSESFDDD